MKKFFCIFISMFFLLMLVPIKTAVADVTITVYQDQSIFLDDTKAHPIPFPADAGTALPTKPWTAFTDYSCTSGETGITLSGNGNTVTIKPENGSWICFLGSKWNAGTGNTNPTPTSPTIVANGEDDYLVVGFNKPVHAIGFGMLTNSSASETITLTFIDNSTKTVSDAELGTSSNSFEFFGFKSNQLIKSVRIDTTGGASQNEGITGIWTFENNPPVADPNGPYLGAANTPISFNGTGSTDLDGDLLSYTWTFGDDGTTTDAQPSHIYSSVGIYDVCLKVNDGPDYSDQVCTIAVVYDLSAGFVTGGGWINSPPGAYKLHDHDILANVWDQGFETDITGWMDAYSDWYGTVTRAASGTGEIISSAGAYHAVFEGDTDSGPFSRLDGYRSTWPGTWTAEIDVYLDPSWTNGMGFDYSVAATGTDGAHQRDYIFHITKDTSTGKLYVAGSNNTNFAPREDLENINHYEVSTAGWYTFQHVFRTQSGALAVDLNLLDSSGNLLFTETRFNAADLIPQEVGGNRYAWFTFINVVGGIAVDEHQLTLPVSPTGKATFGFVSKYKKGATVPEGNTEFQFQAGNLNFHSSSYEWLVVNQAGSNSQFKGEGTINGTGDYKFMLWAGDFETGDTFRIKIWEEVNGDEVVVYDNNPDQVIGGGNIIVHTAKK